MKTGDSVYRIFEVGFLEAPPLCPRVGPLFVLLCLVLASSTSLAQYKPHQPVVRLRLRADDHDAVYPVMIDPWVESGEFTASDGRPDDELGYSVAVSGDTAVVGAIFAKGKNGRSGPGAVYVFVKPADGWKKMTQTAELTASDGATLDYFGNSVAISGNVIVVGAPYHRNQGEGAAYVFVRPKTGWADGTETAELTPSDAGGALGYSVAIDGDTVAAGAYQANSGHGDDGAAYVFVRPAEGWKNATENALLTASDSEMNWFLGYSIAISGDAIVSGAIGANGGSNSQGAGYLFVKPATGWATGTETAKLIASDGIGGDDFGFSSAIRGNVALLGAPRAAIKSHNHQGGAYVFVKPKSGWVNMTETAKLTASNGNNGNLFGYSVSLDAGNALVGAPQVHVTKRTLGTAYLFARPASGWSTTDKFKVRLNVPLSSYFGASVALRKGLAIAGAPGPLGTSTPGAGYVFEP